MPPPRGKIIRAGNVDHYFWSSPSGFIKIMISIRCSRDEHSRKMAWSAAGNSASSAEKHLISLVVSFRLGVRNEAQGYGLFSDI